MKWLSSSAKAAALALAGVAAGGAGEAEIRLITLDPGHFHAALIQKQRLPGMSDRVRVYAPLGPDLAAHLNRIAAFNSRRDNPTDWKLEIYAGADFLQRMLASRDGNVVVLSGRNRGKIGRVRAALGAGLHVLADKPWILEASELPQLEAALEDAERSRRVAYDAMTQRFEISCILPRELVNDPEIFGERLPGSPSQPAARMESVHYLLKEVAGVPNLRPAWFFDIREQGEGLTDVGTHLVDLIMWTLFPDQAIDYRRDIRVLDAERWPTILTEEQFRRVTGERRFPDFLSDALKDGRLPYYCNNRVRYEIRGMHVALDVRWDFEAPPGMGDTELAIFRGSRASVEVRQGAEEKFIPEVYVVPVSAADKDRIRRAVEARLARLGERYPGLALEDQGSRLHILIPKALRIGHEEHFALLVERFLGYLRHPETLPAWEKPNMLAKYYVTTQGVALGRAKRAK
jgi:predicted dehydrogenase